MQHVEITHFQVFCGLGGAARGFNRGEARVGQLEARFTCLGGIDSDAAACRDFERLAGVPATCLDLFSLEQYVAFHGNAPPPGWREAEPSDFHRAAGSRRPNILFLSAPCKGFSGLLAERLSRTGKYQALNALTLRGVWLALEAWKDDPPELIAFENVPRIATRGRHLLDQIVALLRAYGYAVAETTHDCGELGGLAQSRKRFLLMARHVEKVPPFLYEPPKRPLRGVGEVLDKLPLPLSGAGGAMHRMPSLHWKTWVRLAFVEAGSDWRSLNKLRVVDGNLADFRISPEKEWWPRSAYGVLGWDDISGTVTAGGRPGQGHFSVADPRIDGHPKSVQYGVRPWDEPAPVVTSKMIAGGGPHSVADPRIDGRPRFNNVFRIVPYGEHSPAVAGAGGPAGGLAVADPRYENWHPGASSTKLRVARYDQPGGCVTAAQQVASGALAVADPRCADHPSYKATKYRVTGYDEAAGTVIGASTTGNGAFAVADPRPDFARGGRICYATGGHYGVTGWGATSRAVLGHPKNNNGPWSVADPRTSSFPPSDEAEKINTLPAPDDRMVSVIRALDGTWHRPFTTLELAALQSLVDPEEFLELDGLSDSAWRERIGNAVPPDAAAAMSSVMGRTLLMAWSGQSFALSSEPIWVQPFAVALSVMPGEIA